MKEAAHLVFIFLYMKLITITGSSGAGKDTVARMLSEMTGIPVLCSYTTRPKRDGEMNGKEHYFVKECNVPQSEMLAYTKYGGYEYWTCVDQINDSAIYVIDEDGMRELYRRFPQMPTVHIYVNATAEDLQARGISAERIARDADRQTLPESFYQYTIHNVGTKTELKRIVRCCVDWMKMKGFL